MRRVFGLVLAMSVVAVLTGGFVPAFASNGKLSSSVKSYNGGGAYVSATWTWVPNDEYRLNNLYINDRCNAQKRGDGLDGFVQVWIKRSSGNVISGSYPDLGGCGSAPRKYAVMTWEGAAPIDAGGLQACVGKYDKKEIRFTKVKCGPISWRTNHRR